MAVAPCSEPLADPVSSRGAIQAVETTWRVWLVDGSLGSFRDVVDVRSLANNYDLLP